MKPSRAERLRVSGQRYVSDELTHFVGRGLPEEEQYALLVHVLRTGELAPGDPARQGEVRIVPGEPLSGNRAVEPEAVCLCDIPVGDLAIHIEKYSPFGLAFPKRALVAAGANPMLYVVAERAARWDEAFRHHLRLKETIRDDGFARFAAFLDREVFAYTKFFHAHADEADPENYYMEREWRMLGTFRFRLADVRRVIVPEAYGRRLREDVPDYCAEVTFGPQRRRASSTASTSGQETPSARRMTSR